MDAVYYHATEYYKKYVDNVENMFDDHDNNTLKPRQNKHHFPDDIFQNFSLNEDE